MANRGMNSLQTQCAMELIGEAEQNTREVLGDVDVRFNVKVTPEGVLDLGANVADLGSQDPDMVLYALADAGVSSAVILDGDPVDPRGLLE